MPRASTQNAPPALRRLPSTRDPVVMADLFWNQVPRAARRLKLQLGRALPVRARLNQYRSNRREAMQVFMQDLEQALVALMPDASRAMTTDAGEL